MTLDAESRKVLEQLADQLIPPGETMPSASQAEIDRWYEPVLKARPDLAEPLANLVASARGKDPHAFVNNLRQSDEATFGVLSEVVCGAYFMNPKVQQAIGYTGQTPQAIDPRVDYMEDGLLESVINRGPIYRPTPEG